MSSVQHPTEDVWRNWKLLIKFPSRSRPFKFLHALEKMKQNVANAECVDWVITMDEDDATMNNTEVRGAINKLLPTAEIKAGTNRSKIEAMNANINDRDFDILFIGQDDISPLAHGFDNTIRQVMAKQFPTLDGVLWFNDGHQGTRLNTYVICGKTYYDRFGYVYHPDYKSLWCDNEYMDVARHLNRHGEFVKEVVLEHQHPSFGFGAFDALMIKNDASESADQRLYHTRKAAGFISYRAGEEKMLLSGEAFHQDVNCCLDDRYPSRLWPLAKPIPSNNVIMVRTECIAALKPRLVADGVRNATFVSHNSDSTFGHSHLDMLLEHASQIWAVNCAVSHPVMRQLPLGFRDNQYVDQRILKRHAFLTHTNRAPRDILCLCRFAVATNPGERQACLDRFAMERWCISTPLLHGNPVIYPAGEQESFLTQISKSKYVICPAGSGQDTHRVYEALFLGAVPIVRTSFLNPLYRNLPALIVDNWHDITEHKLMMDYENLKSKVDAFNRTQWWCSPEFWFRSTVTVV